jgi:O-methyltransferase
MNSPAQPFDKFRYSHSYRKRTLIDARRIVTRPLRGLIRKFGFDIVFAPQYGFPPDFEQRDIDLVRSIQPHTMTAPEKIFALLDAIRYISLNNIEGDIVECGVWKGGSMMAAAKSLLALNDTRRKLYLFDTFAGMPEPSQKDVDYSGTLAAKRLEKEAGVQAFAPLHEVQQLMKSTGYPCDRVNFVKGKVEETIPASAPDRIALLRLDTDWYESTRHELIHLFPRLSAGGVLIIDDYGCWTGCKSATEEYFSQNSIRIFLSRAEFGRIAVKQ